MEDEKIVIEKNGQKISCDILFTFESEDTDKLYVGYTDHSIAANGRKNIYVGAYDPVLGIGTLEDIKTDEEMAMLQDVLEELDRQSRN